jgi:RNA-directed DNA polymerase
MEDGAVRHSVTGTAQGGVISPLLANVYLDRLDRAWQTRGHGVLVRYADDLVVMCKNGAEAGRALGALKLLLGELGLTPKWAKTRIVHLKEGGEGLDFLGFHHRWVRAKDPGKRHVCFLARWPSRRAMQHARQRVRELTARERLRVPIEDAVRDLNRFVRGWVGYFRYGNSTLAFEKISPASTRAAGGSPPSTPAEVGLVAGPLPISRPPGPVRSLPNRHRPPAHLGAPRSTECRR